MRGRRQRLEAEIAKALELWCSEPFQWGTGDCFLSIADIIEAALGYDPAAMMRGCYTTSRGAARATRIHGGFAGAFAYVAECAGWREIKPSQALVGDVGLIRDSKGPRGGAIRNRGGLWVGRTMTAYAGFPSSRIERAWRVK